MPDHFHGLFEARESDCDFTKFACMFKQRTVFAHKGRTGKKLWQEAYVDRAPRREEATLDVVAYILENLSALASVRILVRYPFVGSSLYSVDELFESLNTRSKWRP